MNELGLYLVTAALNLVALPKSIGRSLWIIRTNENERTFKVYGLSIDHIDYINGIRTAHMSYNYVFMFA